MEGKYGTPKQELQFLCRIQTVDAIENYFMAKGKRVLTLKKENIIKRNGRVGVLNDVEINELADSPTLISNILQYTPQEMIITFIMGLNVVQQDPVFGIMQ